MVCLSAAFYLSAAPEPAMEHPDAPAARATREAPVPPPPAPPPYVRVGEMPPPRIAELKNAVPCVEAEGDRYKGHETAAFKEDGREGVTLFNGCSTEIIIADVRASETSIAYTASLLPSRAVLRAPRNKEGKDLLVALSRDGARCDKEGPQGRICRMVALPPGRNMFFQIPFKQWFSIRLLDGRRIDGYLLEPFDPKAPPQPKETVKMPDKGFIFKRME